MTAECFRCGSPADTRFGSGYLCQDCQPDENASEEPRPGDTNPGESTEKPGSSTPDPADARAAFGDRLRDAGLDTKRFIDVLDGKKESHDHTQREPGSPHLTGNYGVYGGPGDGDTGTGELIDIDVDDYKEDAESDGLDAVNTQPDTFTVESPHTDGDVGGHRYYRVVAGDEFDNAREAAHAATGATNPDLSWGEVRVKNQYVVGPGSQLDGCDKDWCDECATPEGGYYKIAADRPIATITADDFYALLDADPETSASSGSTGDRDSARTYDDDIPTPDVPGDAPDDLPTCYKRALEARVTVPDEAPHAHAINRDAAILAIYAGYDVETAIEHFRDYPLRGDASAFEYGTTRTSLVGTADKIDDGDLHPPGVPKLRDLGILADDEDCNCRIHRTTTDDETDDADPTKQDVTLDPAVAWRAASTVGPDDLDDDLDLATTTAGNAWECPLTGETVTDVARAVALHEGDIERYDADLANRKYHRAYELARTEYGAPLPEYLSAEDTADHYHHVQGAVRQLTHHHFDRIDSTVTGFGDDADVVAELNPTWEDSSSEKRIVAFASGGFYCREHEQYFDALRFVALEQGILDSEDGALEGDAFRDAYQAARNQYGAPLPEWRLDAPDVVPVLPDPEDLLDNLETDADALTDARERVEGLYREIASDTGETNVLNSLPALGKTTSVVKNAGDIPALYTTPRKELMAEVEEKARDHGVSWMHLPVFAEHHPSERFLDAAVAEVYDTGKELLKHRDDLLAAVTPDDENEDDTDTDADENSEREVVGPDGTTGTIPEPDEEEINPDRASCPTANGTHGRAWQLAVHTAKELGHTPEQIHNLAHSLFGEELPCGDGCAYTDAWDRVADPETPIDLLIGHYVFAHVTSACTYYYREDDRTKVTPRAVVVDEFPGDAYATEFGSEALDHATWLASALRDDIQDREDLLDARNDLRTDGFVSDWLAGDIADNHEEVATLREHVDALTSLLDAVTTATDLLDDHAEALAEYGLTDAIAAVRDAHPEWDAEQADDLCGRVQQAYNGRARRNMDGRACDRVEDLFDALRTTSFTTPDVDPEDVLEGTLADLVTDAVDRFRNAADGARGLLNAAHDALGGGADGCTALAVYADDGYAHPDAHHLLHAAIANPEDAGTVDRLHTDSFGFTDDTDGTTLRRTRLTSATTLFDRQHKGALLHDPPGFTAADGVECPVVGLDATGRDRLWGLALGRSVDIVDIHDTRRRRREFLADVMNLQIVQTTDKLMSYEGSTDSKNFTEDLELIREVADRYSQTQYDVERTSDHQLDLTNVYGAATNPGVITTKVVRQVLEAEAGDEVEEFAHYGDLIGSNALARLNVGIVLGCQHFGDAEPEKWAALAGEECTRTGRGSTLDYGSGVANEFLKHMRRDKTMQAILRFGRDEEGAVVFAHTAALRDDLPVVADGVMLKAFSRKRAEIGRAAKQHRGTFTVADLADAVDASTRTIQRALDEFSDLGYLNRRKTKNGVTNTYRAVDAPGDGHAQLPDTDVHREAVADPDSAYNGIVYTWTVVVARDDPGGCTPRVARGSVLPAPGDGVVANPPD